MHAIAVCLMGVAGLAPLHVWAQTNPATTTAVQDVNCPGAFQPGLNCNANEFTVAATLQGGANSPPFCVVGSSIELDLNVLLSGSNTDRYNIQFYAAQNGQQPESGGTCSGTVLPITGIPSAPTQWFNAGANTCADLHQTQTIPQEWIVQKVKVNCQADASGRLSVPYALTYNNNLGSASSCPIGASSPDKCTTKTATIEVNAVPISAAGYVDVKKVTAPSGATSSFTFDATAPTGSRVGYAVSSDNGATFSPITSGNSNATSVSITDGQVARIYMSVTAANRTLNIAEVLNADWQSTAAISCSAVTGSPTLTTSNANRTIAATLTTTNSAASCTVTNTQRPRISLNKTVAGRVAAADQFTVQASSAGTLYTDGTSTTVTSPRTGTTTGTATSLAAPVVFRSTPGTAVVLSEAMASGSGNALSAYDTRLTCTNAASFAGATPNSSLPNNTAVASQNITPVAGDDISCIFTNTPKPRVTLTKAIGAPGRAAATNQFTVQILEGATVVNAASASTTTGSGSTVDAGTGTTGVTLLNAGTAYTLGEVAAGSTSLANYAGSISCSNANAASSTVLPSGAGNSFALTPSNLDVISCELTNTRKSAQFRLAKTWSQALANDAASIGASSGLGNNTVAFTSTAPTATTGASVTVYAGEVATLPAETMTTGAFGSYNVALSCDNGATPSGTDGKTSNTVAIPETITAATTITCTYANTAAKADLSITKSNATTSLTPGDTTSYTIIVSNRGPLALPAGTRVSDTVQSGLTCPAVADSPTAVGCSSATAGVCPGSGAGTSSSMSFASFSAGVLMGAMPANSSATFTTACKVN